MRCRAEWDPVDRREKPEQPALLDPLALIQPCQDRRDRREFRASEACRENPDRRGKPAQRDPLAHRARRAHKEYRERKATREIPDRKGRRVFREYRARRVNADCKASKARRVFRASKEYRVNRG